MDDTASELWGGGGGGGGGRNNDIYSFSEAVVVSFFGYQSWRRQYSVMLAHS